jgi:Ser-tRNA(Ala) deacylase AlaX
MKQLYLEDAYLKEHKTTISQQRIMKKKTAVTLEENIFHPTGGGQLFDIGFLTVGDTKIDVTRIIKEKKDVWLCLETKDPLPEGTEVMSCIDWERRYKFMRCHTVAHVTMGAIKRHVDGYVPEGIEISEEGEIELSFSGKWDSTQQSVDAIIKSANETISRGGKVRFEEFEDINDAVEKNKDIFRGTTDLKGDVRIIVVEDWDANPCGGTHVKKLSELGIIELVEFSPRTVIIRIQ